MKKIHNFKTVPAVVSIMCLLVLAACGQLTSVDTDDRYIEAEGGFSYIPPLGWQTVQFPGLKYKMAMGEEIANFRPNLNFIDEVYTGSFDSYVTGNLNAINIFFTDVNIISQEDFQTDHVGVVIKVIIENTQNEKRLHQTFYFLDAGDRKFVITYTRSPDTGEENDVLVDQSIKTFRLEKT